MLNLMLLLDLIDISILEQGEFSKAIEQPIAKCDLLYCVLRLTAPPFPWTPRPTAQKTIIK